MSRAPIRATIPAVKLEDFGHYLELRRLATNPWEALRFRKTQLWGRTLELQLVGEPPLFLRGETNDYHMFHRIYLRDEYGLSNRRGWECVIDLGGNVGIFSARASGVAKRVVAYEPVPENFARFQLHCGERPNVEAVRAAVASKSGSLRIYRPRLPGMTGVFSSFREMGGHMTDDFLDVDAITLDELMERHQVMHCDMMKVDVEGQEYEIVNSASDANLARIDRIHGEYHNVQEQDPRTRIDHFAKYLQSKGYEVDTRPHKRKANHGFFYARRPGLT